MFQKSWRNYLVKKESWKKLDDHYTPQDKAKFNKAVGDLSELILRENNESFREFDI